jgi:hypothetical protein
MSWLGVIMKLTRRRFLIPEPGYHQEKLSLIEQHNTHLDILIINALRYPLHQVEVRNG